MNWQELRENWPQCFIWSATTDNLLIGRAEYQHVLAAELSQDGTFWVNTVTMDVIDENYAKQAYAEGHDVALVRIEMNHNYEKQC